MGFFKVNQDPRFESSVRHAVMLKLLRIVCSSFGSHKARENSLGSNASGGHLVYTKKNIFKFVWKILDAI